MRGQGALSDPYAIVHPLYPYGAGAYGEGSNAGGKAFRSPVLIAGEKTAVIVAAGQSNIANNVKNSDGTTSRYTPSNATKVDNVSLSDGGTYAGSDPLLGCDSSDGNFLGRMADKLINAGVFQRVILAPTAVSATSISRWAPGGDLNSQIMAACRRLRAIGLTPTMFLWQQGESDHGMTRNAYATNLLNVIASPRAEGFNAPWFIGQSTFDGSTTDANVRQACADVVNNTDVFAGADTDTITSTVYRQPVPSPHFNPTGADAQAELWKVAVDVVF
jgi:hypothetical protein